MSLLGSAGLHVPAHSHRQVRWHLCRGISLAAQTATFSNSRENPGGQLPRNPATRSEMRTCAPTSQEATHLLSQAISSTRRREGHAST